MHSLISAVLRITIEAPPGSNKVAPKLAVVYNRYQKTGWIGVGWSLDMGAIQRGKS